MGAGGHNGDYPEDTAAQPAEPEPSELDKYKRNYQTYKTQLDLAKKSHQELRSELYKAEELVKTCQGNLDRAAHILADAVTKGLK